MTYEEWLEQLDTNGKALREKKETLKKAAKKCSPETQKDLQEFLENLDLMFSVEKVPEGMELFEEQEEPRLSKDDFFSVALKMGGAISDLVNDYRTPVEFLAQKGVKEALTGILKEADAESRISMPDFVDKVGDRRKACAASPLRVAAHYYAFKDTPGVTITLEELYKALPVLARRERDPVLKKTVQDKEAVEVLWKDPDKFAGFYDKKLEEELSKTSSFKEYRDEIVKDYRDRKIRYAELDLRMSALRALVPGKNDNEREQQQISLGDYRKKLRELRAAEQKKQEAAKNDGAADRETAKEGISDREIKTTAKDIYDQLTKEYKAGKLTYARYEDRLRTMRELTGDNKQARIDLQTIDEAIENRIEENMQKNRLENCGDPIESIITAMMETESGVFPQRVQHIDETYGVTPIVNEKSLMKEGSHTGGYTREQFAQLKEIRENPGENDLRLNGKSTISQEDFAALAVAVTQAIPEIGCVNITMKTRDTDRPNVISKPTLELIPGCRSLYFTELDRGDEGKARDGIGGYIGTTIAPARIMAEEALRSYRAGTGSPEKLGMILGVGLHQFVSGNAVADPDTGKLKPDCLVECAFAGRLAEIMERHPALKEEALLRKYTTQEEIDKAKGLGILYKISAGAELAEKKLSAAAAGGQKLSDDERKACVELLLRRKVLQDDACRQANANLTPQKIDEINKEYIKASELTGKETVREKEEKDVLATALVGIRMSAATGLPDYLRSLGAQGESFAKAMLDSYMPSRDAFLKKTDSEILTALEAKFGSNEDPFMDKRYTKKADRRNDAPEVLPGRTELEKDTRRNAEKKL